MRGAKVRPVCVLLCSALALTAGVVAEPAGAQNLGERIGTALNRSAQATGRAARRAGSATGAAADRSLSWAQRKVHRENRARDERRTRERRSAAHSRS